MDKDHGHRAQRVRTLREPPFASHCGENDSEVGLRFFSVKGRFLSCEPAQGNEPLSKGRKEGTSVLSFLRTVWADQVEGNVVNRSMSASSRVLTTQKAACLQRRLCCPSRDATAHKPQRAVGGSQPRVWPRERVGACMFYELVQAS